MKIFGNEAELWELKQEIARMNAVFDERWDIIEETVEVLDCLEIEDLATVLKIAKALKRGKM